MVRQSGEWGSPSFYAAFAACPCSGILAAGYREGSFRPEAGANKGDGGEMGQLLKQGFLVCVFLFSFTGQATADPLADAQRAYSAGDYAKAAKLYVPLAKKGDVPAQYNLGVMYEDGQGVTQDYKEAVKWYRMAAEQGNAKAPSSIGSMYADGKGFLQDYKEAAKWYRMAAELGNASVQYILGVNYDNGQGVPQDYKEAVKWYRMAAQQGDAKAQSNLGVKYEHGHGVPQDHAEAVKWYRMAAEQGNAPAQRNLGVMYANGEGVPQNYALAYMWASIAAASAADSEDQKKSAELRDSVSSLMTASQIAEAQELSRKCAGNKLNEIIPRLCREHK